jgi:hypothetical protein
MAAGRTGVVDLMLDRLRAIATIDLLILLISTTLASELLISWRLWFPAARTFPSIPAVEQIPLVVNDEFAAALSVAVLCSLATINLPRLRRPSLAIFLTGILLLVLSDLARFQPWLFMQATMLALLVGGSLAKRPVAEIVGWILLLMATTYFWSGIQKLNVYFLTEVFPWLIEPFYNGPAFALSAEDAEAAKMGSLPFMAYPVLIVPVIECLTGIWLLIGRTRRIGAASAIAMHSFILIALGPLGRSWNFVIWPWNIGMILLLIVLVPIRSDPEAQTRLRERPQKMVLSALILIFGVMPLFNFTGHWDYYLSGSLYAGTNSTGEYFYDRRVDDFSDTDSAGHIASIPDVHQDIINLDMWAFSSMRTPLYPETRYFKALGRRLCSQTNGKGRAGLRITKKSKFTAVRSQSVYFCRDLKTD